MLTLWIPVALSIFLGPGMGQLYNKEYKKGALLIVFSLALLLAFSVWLSKAAMSYMPSDLATLDREALRTIIQTNVIGGHPKTFFTYEMLLLGTWIYGVVDAYRGGVRRRSKMQSSIS